MRLCAVLLLGMMSALPSRTTSAGDAASLRVVTSFTVLSDLTHEIGAEWVSVQPLVGPDGDAHVYQPTPADVRAVGKAHIVILNGLGFEGWMNRLLDSAQFHGTVVIATDGVIARRIGGHPDPHAWQDPRNVRTYVTNIGTHWNVRCPLTQRNSKHARCCTSSIWSNWIAHYEPSFAAIPEPRRRVITTHDASGISERLTQLKFLPVQGWTTESEPSAAAVGRLVEQPRHAALLGYFSKMSPILG